MARIRKTYNDEFKFKIALAALRGDRTIARICQEFGVHATLVHKWKAHLKTHGPSLFGRLGLSTTLEEVHEAEKAKLYQQIGQLSVERDFLKKTLER